MYLLPLEAVLPGFEFILPTLLLFALLYAFRCAWKFGEVFLLLSDSSNFCRNSLLITHSTYRRLTLALPFMEAFPSPASSALR